ncbi:cache domain-containing protein [Zhihengliuella sp.]|uniref:cache domain-containing protein n=1 Tax=Zhihengliuella sp. TaxID=1954483 RepID=UPI00281128C9|nr:cache domain-containing protein [Zhihengliuella sp.]
MAETSGAEARIAEYFTEVVDLVRPWASSVGRLFDDGRPPSAQAVDSAVAALVTPTLRSTRRQVVGAGFIAAPDSLSGTTWHMAWWQGPEPQRLATVSPAEAGEIYARREWFTVPMETGEPHITGPYVDFLCTDDYTVTITVPVPAATPAGVVGADLLVAALEEPLERELAAVAPTASLVNRAGRVLVSADPEVAAGTVLVGPWRHGGPEVGRGGGAAADTVQSGCRLLPLPALPLAVMVP